MSNQSHNTISEETHKTARQREYEEFISVPRNPDEVAAFDLQSRIDLASQTSKQSNLAEAYVDGKLKDKYHELEMAESRGQTEEDFQKEQLDAQQKHYKRWKVANDYAMSELEKAMKEGKI